MSVLDEDYFRNATWALNLISMLLLLYPILTILFKFFGLFAPKHSKIIWFSSHLTKSIPEEGNSRNVPTKVNNFVFIDNQSRKVYNII